MWPVPNDTVRAAYKNKTPLELIGAPVDSIIGVSAAAAKTLTQFGITSIFDLAKSNLFAAAYEIDRAAERQADGWAQYGIVPGDRIDAQAREFTISDLQVASASLLRDIGPQGASDLEANLYITTIRDLGLWPPYHIARFLLSSAFALSDGGDSDPEAPAELVPGARQYPTQRAQYQVVVLDTAGHSQESSLETGRASNLKAGAATNPLPPLDSAGPLDLAAVARGEGGATQVAMGALLTYTQSWFTEGLALGQLLHTLALAPGESTRIAMIDWSRAARATTKEGITESEALTSTLNRGRVITETVNAVLKEAQSGFSGSIGGGNASQAGTASGGAGSADLSSAGYPIKLAGGSGESTGFGSAMGGAASFGYTSGQRDLSANMAQNIQDMTQQASNLVRTRWATVVTEVDESEEETITTRTVTNYNHMHALSVEYFEVVQLHRVVVELAKADRCLFVPFKVFDFDNHDILWRYRREIARAGITPEVRELLWRDPDTMVMTRPADSMPWDATEIASLVSLFTAKAASLNSTEISMPRVKWSWNYAAVFVASDSPFEAAIIERYGAPDKVVQFVDSAIRLGGAPTIALKQANFSNISSTSPEPTDPAGAVRRILLRRKAGSEAVTGTHKGWLALVVPGPILLVSAVVSVTIDLPTDAPEVELLRVQYTVLSEELDRHVSENALYYTQAILRNVDVTVFAQLLSGYSLGNRPAIEFVDPMPAAVIGNYLVFRVNRQKDESDAAWNAWLESRDINVGERKEDFVPLPSGGVFAEAVLGRFNSAEKLDITRFWNWQDSPIPIVPTEIAAIQAGSRAKAEPPTPGQLSAPVLNIVNPPAAPDPSGLAAALTAIQNGNAFRDMSGLSATIGFAQAAMGRSADAARDAAAQAGQNMRTAADIYSAAFGSGRAGGGTSPTRTPSPPTVSNAGGLINYGERLDRGAAGGGGPRGGGAASDFPALDGYNPGSVGGSWAQEAFTNELGYPRQGGGFQTVGWSTSGQKAGGPQLLLRGEAATAQAARLLERATPVQLPNGQEVRPGAIFNDDTLLVDVDTAFARFMRRGDLYEWSTSQFLRNEYLRGWQRGVQTAETFVELTYIEISLLAGIYVNIVFTVGAGMVDSGLKIYKYRSEADRAFQAMWKLKSGRDCVAQTAPKLLSELESMAFWAVVRELPRQINARQVAFYLGRLLRGTANLGFDPAIVQAPVTSLLGLAKVILTATVLVGSWDTAINTPPAIEAALTKATKDLLEALEAESITVSDPQARMILEELRAHPDAIECLRQMREAILEIIPLLELLAPSLLRSQRDI